MQTFEVILVLAMCWAFAGELMNAIDSFQNIRYEESISIRKDLKWIGIRSLINMGVIVAFFTFSIIGGM